MFYWWGVLPFNQRKKLWEKFRNKSKKHEKPKPAATSSSTSSATVGQSTTGGEITVGSQVVIRSYPMYHCGAVGFTTDGGIPKVGQLLNAAWSLNDKCKFKVSNYRNFNVISNIQVS